MMRKIVGALLLMASISVYASLPYNGDVEVVKIHRQKRMDKWGVAGANYSGIAWLGGNVYAVVSDKEKHDGFYMFTIDIDSVSGKVRSVERSGFMGSADAAARDAEGIAYVPDLNTLFISGEADQRVVELCRDGSATGRELAVPTQMDKAHIHPNYGFEALTYSVHDNLLWTVTEHTLKADGAKTVSRGQQACRLRLLSFDVATLTPSGQYAYMMDAPTASKKGRQYALGITALTALDDGTLLVLERECHVAKRYVGSYVHNRIYRVCPSEANTVAFTTDLSTLPMDKYLRKTLVTEFTTRVNITRRSFANYEGMCLGPRLVDGSQTLILISDSQNNYGNRFYHLKDYIKVVVLNRP